MPTMPPDSDARLADEIIDRVRRNSAAGRVADAERRESRRVRYSAVVAIVLVTRDGQRWGPMSVQAKDISSTGMAVVSRSMIHPGLRGAVQLQRSDKALAIVGVEVIHSRYAGQMLHETGLRFTGELPVPMVREEFLNRQGKMILLDERLGETSGEPGATP
jgi:hypothetical protein